MKKVNLGDLLTNFFNFLWFNISAFNQTSDNLDHDFPKMTGQNYHMGITDNDEINIANVTGYTIAGNLSPYDAISTRYPFHHHFTSSFFAQKFFCCFFMLTGVNFINVLHTNFSYKRGFSSYVLTLSKNSYEKFACLMLMKLTAVWLRNYLAK